MSGNFFGVLQSFQKSGEHCRIELASGGHYAGKIALQADYVKVERGEKQGPVYVLKESIIAIHAQS